MASPLYSASTVQFPPVPFTTFLFIVAVAVAGEPEVKVPGIVVIERLLGLKISKFNEPVIAALDGPDSFDTVALSVMLPDSLSEMLEGVALGRVVVVVRQLVVGTTTPLSSRLSVEPPPPTLTAVILYEYV